MPKSDEIALIRRQVLARSIKRKERLAAINDYVQFVVSKLAGFGAVIIGAAEMINPSFHPISTLPPESVLGAGLAMLTGPKIISLIAKVTTAITAK